MSDNKNYITDKDLPLGFGMTLVQNRAAFDYFASLSPSQQQSVINHTQSIQSKQEMNSYVRSLGEQTF